jgi:hypothetical protein
MMGENLYGISPRGAPRRRNKAFMQAGCYEVVAAAIRSIEPPELRQQMADHFAGYFHKASPSFNAYEWEKATGGRPRASDALQKQT